MLGSTQKIGRLLYRIRRVFVLAAAGAAVGLGFAVFHPRAGQGAMLVALTVLLWSVFLLALGQAFARPPPAVADDDRLIARLGIRLRRGLLGLLAVAVLALGAVLVWLTFRFLSVYLATQS